MERQEIYIDYERIKVTGAIRELVDNIEYEVGQGNFRIVSDLANNVVEVAEKYIKDGRL